MTALHHIGRAEPRDAPDAASVARRDWTRALARFEAAAADREAASDRLSAAYASVAAHLPAALCENRPGGRAARWLTLGCLDGDANLSPAERSRLRPALIDWLNRERTLKQEYGVVILEAEDDVAAQAKAQAFEALLATPPADAAALAHKMLLHSKECDDLGVGYSNPKFVQGEEYAPAFVRGAAQFYRDTLTLAARAA